MKTFVAANFGLLAAGRLLGADGGRPARPSHHSHLFAVDRHGRLGGCGRGPSSRSRSPP